MTRRTLVVQPLMRLHGRASVVADDTLLRPMEVVDVDAGARQMAAVLTRLEPPPEDAWRSEDDVTEEIAADMAAAREERRRDA